MPNQVDSGRRWLRAARDPEGEDRNHPATNGQRKLAEGAQETTSDPITQEPGGTKRPTVQDAGARKKMKAQRPPPDYTIMEDDGEMISRMVQDCLVEDFDHAAPQG
jgi:hypothetical protein